MSLSDATLEVYADGKPAWACPQRCTDFLPEPRRPIRIRWQRRSIWCITALLAVFIVLGILYESLIHPLTIISTLPSASVGAMLALMLFHIDLNVISIIGIILLIGIVKKNAIMMIDFALQAERQEGKNTRDAIFEACMLRFRPILMTTMAAIFGALPLAFGTGTGSELRQPLGITIVGGLLLSQLLTLYTTPVVYLVMDRMRLWALGKRRRYARCRNRQGARLIGEYDHGTVAKTESPFGYAVLVLAASAVLAGAAWARPIMRPRRRR